MKRWFHFPKYETATGEHRPVDNGNPDVIGEVDADGFVTLHNCWVVAATDRAVLVEHDGSNFWLSRSRLKVQVNRGHYGDVIVDEEYARHKEVI